MKKIITLILALVVTLPLQAAEVEVLRLHGSNTIGARLGPELVKGWLKAEGYKKISAEETAPQEQKITALSPKGGMIVVEIAAHGSSTGFRSLAAGKADIAMSSRPIKGKELKKLENLGTTLAL